MARDLYDVAEQPPVGEVPKKMHAWLVRPERFGEPKDAFQREVVDVPEIADDEVLVYVMAAGVNYNNVWAALGVPVDVIGARNKAGEPEKFHIGGSDASGIVYKAGKKVTNVKVGDEVVIHCGTWNGDDPVVQRGEDPMFANSFRIWGYETNWGSFAQFTKVQSHQCVPKPRHLSWEGAAAYLLVGATAYRMLLGWPEHALREGDVVLIWGGAGGLGSMAIQIARARGAVPVAIVSDSGKFEYCQQLGAKGCINRKDFSHWGMLPHWKDNAGYNAWLKGVRGFGKALWDILGERKNPRVVFEHPGETTIPTSIFVCDTGGMVVICAGTTGYNATVDLRYLWMRQKRLQGSHFANDEQAQGCNDLVMQGLVDPCLSRTFKFDELPEAHQLMYENRHPHGNMAILVGAAELGTGASAKTPAVAAPHLPPPEREREAAAPYRRSGPALGHPRQSIPAITDTPVAVDKTRVRDLMRLGVVTCTPATPAGDIAKLLVGLELDAVLVVDADNEPVGVISQTDLLLARQGRDPAQFATMKAVTLMTPGCITCDLDTPLSEAISTMARMRIHRLVVVDRQGRRRTPVGVISMNDIIRKTIAAEGSNPGT